YVGGARQIADALKLGAAGTNVIGYALVLGAADWRRCGMTRPVPASLLAGLAKPHLNQRDQAQLADPNAYHDGPASAINDVNPNVSLLQPAGVSCYSVYDYALDCISQNGMPISDGNWDVIVTQAEAPELLHIAYTAWAIYHRTSTAVQAYRKAAGSGHA